MTCTLCFLREMMLRGFLLYDTGSFLRRIGDDRRGNNLTGRIEFHTVHCGSYGSHISA